MTYYGCTATSQPVLAEHTKLVMPMACTHLIGHGRMPDLDCREASRGTR